MRRLPEENLKDLVKLIKENAPDAVTETDTKLEITVDRLFRPQFDVISREVKTWLLNSKKKET